MSTERESPGDAVHLNGPSASPEPSPRYTPSPARYFGAAVLAVALFSAAWGVLVAVQEAGRVPEIETSDVLRTAAAGSAVVGTLAVACAVVFGLPLTAIAHLLLRDEPAQSVHVLVFGLVGAVSALGLLAVLGGLGWTSVAWLMVTGAGASTALGRLVVGRGRGPRRNAGQWST